MRVLFVDYPKAFDLMGHTFAAHTYFCCHCEMDLLVLLPTQTKNQVNENLSDWITLNGCIPQGGYLAGTIVIHCLFNDLRPHCSCRKFVDDITLTENLGKDISSAALP